MYVSLCYSPLTMVAPAFYGPGIPVSPYSYPSSRLIPSIYTAAGAALTLVHLATDAAVDDIEDMVEKGYMQVYGVYVRSYFKEEKPLMLVPVYAFVSKDGAIIPLRPSSIVERERGESEIRVEAVEVYTLQPSLKIIPVTKPREGEEVLVLIPLTREGATPNSVYRLEVEASQRTRIRMNPKRKVAEVGGLFSHTGVEQFKVCRGRKCTTQVEFCVDIELPESIGVKLRGYTTRIVAQDFGGTASLARPRIEYYDEPTPLVEAAGKIRKGRYSLAVSHIVLYIHKSQQRETIITPHGYKLTAFAGRIEALTGWLFKVNKPKTPRPALTPGSIVQLDASSHETPVAPAWWEKLAATLVPILY